MKKYLRLFKKNKTQFIIDSYKFVFLCQYSYLDSEKIKILKNLLVSDVNCFYRLKQDSFEELFEGHSSLLFLYFNKGGTELFKRLLDLTFLKLVFVKNFYIFPRRKIDSIFKFNNFFYLKLNNICFIFIFLLKKIYK